ncbi:MAG: hypothetical protein ACYSU0_18330 [Planctomycetota bacterium]
MLRRSICVHLRSSAVAFAVLLLAGALPGCNAVKPGRTPAATFEAARRAVREENYEGLWLLLCAKARDAEALRIGQEKRRIEEVLEQLTPAEKEALTRQKGISPEDFVDLTPAQVFAMELRRGSQNVRMMGALRRTLERAIVGDSRKEGDRALLAIEIPEEGNVEVEFVFERGLYKLPSKEGFFEALGSRRRARRAGRTPEETHRAAQACIADGALEELWALFSPRGQKSIAGIVRREQESVRKLPAEQLRSFERKAGVTGAEFAAMSPKEAFVVELRAGVGSLRAIRKVLLGRFVSAEIDEDEQSGTVSIRSTMGTVGVRVEQLDGRWYFGQFE